MKEPKHREVRIPVTETGLTGDLCMPEGANGLVVFAHGSGSSRKSPRNLLVASNLCLSGFGTLLFDLLTEEEDRVYDNRFDIPLLATRLEEAVVWAKRDVLDQGVSIGLFGASTGAAAALIAASRLDGAIEAVVSRGGRPDLAREALAKVACPTLLIVGSLDSDVIALNRKAMAQMPGGTEVSLEIVPKATHLFPEPGALEEVSRLAQAWFEAHLPKTAPSSQP
ncbi:MAG TPA: alpha/beta hydrolase [Fimbriimonadaceae bacterium]|nr:alpha/beta hydrolase [Fimbriimonadaceae bacterium]